MEKKKYKKNQMIQPKNGISPMPPLDDDEEEVKQGKRINMLNLNKLLTRLPVLLGQIKAENNSYKLKNVISQKH